jgi:DNA helicase-2/ATP-dependent DNA helicase PcrA
MAVSKAVPVSRTFQPDERQRQAIEHVHGPMLVVAGAGTGKTTVLIRRIACLIQQGHARPDEILAVTYTDNAAKEMRQRVEAELGGSSLTGLQVKTFHAYCNELLTRNGKQFGVLDDQDLWIYLRKRLPELQLNYFVRAANVARFLDGLLDFVRRCHDELVGPEKYTAYVTRLERGDLPLPRVAKSKEAVELADDEIIGRCREIANVFATVERMLQEDNLGTFGHMITRAHELLDNNPDLLVRERQRTRFILADEFQDANFAQLRIIEKLAGKERNVFAVGDPDQAIYRFRGASSAAFQLFSRQFPEAKQVILEKNRRSTTPILKCAHSVISANPGWQHVSQSTSCSPRTPLTSARDEEARQTGKLLQNPPVDIVVLTAKEAEGGDVVSAILQLRKQSRCKWKDFAVLYRSHWHRDELVLELAENSIPFTIENMDVVDTPKARDLFACLGAVVSDADGASLLRVAALPQFSISGEQLRAGIKALPRDAEAAGIALVLRQVPGGATVLESLRQVREEIVQAQMRSHAALELIIRRFALDRQSPVLAAVLEFVARWENKATTTTGNLPELLEYLAYFREARGMICLPVREEDDAVRLMTAHSAKGLEFDHVFILRVTANSFPCSYKEPLIEFPFELRDADSISEEDDKALQVQEERRLFYVAMTRARNSLTISAREGKGKKDPTPPGYLRELLNDRALQPYLRRRPARGFQTDLFAQATLPSSRTEEWLSMPPGTNLSERLSASSVAVYDTCPLQFKLEREWRIPGEASAAMQFGGAMHLVLRSYYDSVRFEREMSEEALIELFQTTLRDAHIQEEYQHRLYEAQGIAQLRRFLATCRKSPVPEVLHTEQYFDIKLGNATVVGRIDRMDAAGSHRIAITDYKTGKPKSQEDAEESLQLSIYAIAAQEKWGYAVEHLAFYNLEENSRVITRREKLQLQEARLKVEDVAAKIAQGDFAPKPGFHCRFCAYSNLCPATEKRIHSA